MGPNRSFKFKYHGFGKYAFEQMPKGELLRFGVNPYNGNVVVTFQDRDIPASVALGVIQQVYSDSVRLSAAAGYDCGLRELADMWDAVQMKTDNNCYPFYPVENGAALLSYFRDSRIA